MSKKVVGMHFVCRGNKNVTDNGNGTFDTGFWFVNPKHRATVEYVALHDSKATTSYRQGRVISARDIPYEGKIRTIFTVRPEGGPRAWEGGGSGEKGFLWR